MGHTVRHTRARRRSVWRWLLILSLIGLILAVLGGTAGVVYVGYHIEKAKKDPRFPKLDDLVNYDPKVSTLVYDRNGTLLGEIADERRVPVQYDEFPKALVQAVVAAEDQNFWTHDGIDYLAIVRAMIRNFRSGRFSQGGSTITQQVVKNVLFPEVLKTKSKTLDRKFMEVAIAWEIEEKLTKKQILELYLNQIAYGRARYGIESASQYYFGKSVRDLTLVEAATLAGVPQSPERHNPRRFPERAKARRGYVIGRMLALGMIDRATAEGANAVPVTTVKVREQNPYYGLAPEVVDYVREELGRRYPGKRTGALGLRVHTSVDVRWQTEARRLLERGVEAVQARHGHPRPPQGSVVIIDPATREVRVMVGGYRFAAGNFNRALVARRQPGSLMKAYVYAAGFEGNVFNQQTTFVDEEVYLDPQRPDVPWPINYEPEYLGAVSVRSAFAHSVNTIAVMAMKETGVGNVIGLARRVGVTSPISEQVGLSLALGTAEMTPMEVANSYATFPAGGYYRPPVLITRILGRNGEVPLGYPEPKRAIARDVADDTVALMRAVVEEGTGRRAHGQLPGWVAGKTGTTSDHSDAWFGGFTKELTCVVWVGFDERKFLGRHETGANAALPVWLGAMSYALTGKTVELAQRKAVVHEEPTTTEGEELPPPLEPDVVEPLPGREPAVIEGADGAYIETVDDAVQTVEGEVQGVEGDVETVEQTVETVPQ